MMQPSLKPNYRYIKNKIVEWNEHEYRESLIPLNVKLSQQKIWYPHFLTQ